MIYAVVSCGCRIEDGEPGELRIVECDEYSSSEAVCPNAAKLLEEARKRGIETGIRVE